MCNSITGPLYGFTLETGFELCKLGQDGDDKGVMAPFCLSQFVINDGGWLGNR